MRNLPALRLFGCLFLPVSLLLGGCSRNTPPKNHAVRAYPSPEAMAKWTDFSGHYYVKRVKDGDIRNRHRAFIDEAWLRPDAHATITQDGPSNIVVVFETTYDSLLVTNAISVGQGVTPWTWVWDNGKAVYVRSYHGQSTMLPGTVSSRSTCVVSKAEDGTLTVESTRTCGGRLFWVISSEDPVDRSVLQLVPAKPASTPP